MKGIDPREIERTIKRDFCKRLKILRKSKGMTQVEVAQFLNVGASTYAMYEQGAGEPNLLKLRMLSALFNVSLDELLGNSDENSKQSSFEGAMEDWVVEIVNCSDSKKKVIKTIWKEIKNLK